MSPLPSREARAESEREEEEEEGGGAAAVAEDEDAPKGLLGVTRSITFCHIVFLQGETITFIILTVTFHVLNEII